MRMADGPLVMREPRWSSMRRGLIIASLIYLTTIAPLVFGTDVGLDIVALGSFVDLGRDQGRQVTGDVASEGPQMSCF